MMKNWQLPPHIEDIIAPLSHVLEMKRRAMLDLFCASGYQLIMPPLQEYQEALALGGVDLDTRMLKVVDSLSGRMMGLRPDMTPQAARIDAHVLAASTPQNGDMTIRRLCYCDRVLHAYPASTYAPREPIQIGAEIYGTSSWQADAESMGLLVEALMQTGVSTIHFELHHMGLLRTMAALAGFIDSSSHSSNHTDSIHVCAIEGDWLRLLQIKDTAGLAELLKRHQTPLPIQKSFAALTRLYGDMTLIEDAKKQLPPDAQVQAALDDLQRIASKLQHDYPHIKIGIDLADGRGYHYHTGLMYSAYINDAKGTAQAVAHGGRYDGFGEKFGQNRPATGFTIDLLALLRGLEVAQVGGAHSPFTKKIYAPASAWIEHGKPNIEGRAEIQKWRDKGCAVIVGWDEDEPQRPLLPSAMKTLAAQNDCSAWLININQIWQCQDEAS